MTSAGGSSEGRRRAGGISLVLVLAAALGALGFSLAGPAAADDYPVTTPTVDCRIRAFAPAHGRAAQWSSIDCSTSSIEPTSVGTAPSGSLPLSGADILEMTAVGIVLIGVGIVFMRARKSVARTAA